MAKMKNIPKSRLGRYVFPVLQVDVTDEHIEKGLPRNSSYCIFAEAIKDSVFNKFGEMPSRVSVDLQTIRFTLRDRDLRYVYFTPLSVQKALVNFDQGTKPKPFAFRLKTEAGGQILPVYHKKLKVLSDEDRAKLKKKSLQHGAKRVVPIVTGGRTPPRPSLRRAFGLRAFQP